MPRLLFSTNSSWNLLKVDPVDLKIGDLIFVKKITLSQRVSHVGMYLGGNKIFHSTSLKGTCIIQSLEEFFNNYEQTLNGRRMLRYIDSRNIPERERHKGAYIED